MKSNKTLGYDMVELEGSEYVESPAGGNYLLGRRSATDWRAYGYEYHGGQDASCEFTHHHVCGRGPTAEEAIRVCVAAAERAGRAGEENGCEGLSSAECERLLDLWLEALAATDIEE